MDRALSSVQPARETHAPEGDWVPEETNMATSYSCNACVVRNDIFKLEELVFDLHRFFN